MSDEHEGNGIKSRRRKRLSKKTKKGWRKGSDIRDVEQFLEQARNDEITGCRIFNKTSSELIEPGKRGEKAEAGSLKCHRGLTLDSSVPPLHVSQKVFKPTGKPVKKAVVKLAQNRPARPQTTYDLWNTETAASGELDEHYATVCKKQRVKPPARYLVKPSEIQSIEVPLPGASYNPNHNDHQALLKKAIEVEEKKEKEEKKLKRALDDLFPNVSEKSSEAVWFKEMSAGLTNDDVNTDKKEETENEDALGRSSFQAEHVKKKTEKHRRLEQEKLLAERAREKKKESKLRENEKFRLKSIKREIKQREFKLATRAAWKELEKEENKLKPKKLGRIKYEEPTVDVKLSDELVDSLRKLKPEGHVAQILFKQLQKKNIIEPRKRAKPMKRCKSKLFEKKGHRSVTV